MSKPPSFRPLAVTPIEAARMLSISLPTLYRLDLPKVYLGPRTVRYLVTDLEAWLAERKSQSAE